MVLEIHTRAILLVSKLFFFFLLLFPPLSGPTLGSSTVSFFCFGGKIILELIFTNPVCNSQCSHQMAAAATGWFLSK